MAAKKQYYSTAEVQEILGVSRTTANEIMHQFEKRGQLFRWKNTMRVKIKDFDEWVKTHTSRPAA